MLHIDLPADLHFLDDADHNLARVPAGDVAERVVPGAVLVAGSVHAWSWAEVVAVEDGWVEFRQLAAGQAARMARPVVH